MNQIVNTQDKMTMNQVGITSTASGSKIAPQNLGEVVKFAEVMSRADIAIPKHLRGNAGACMAVAMQALEWEMSPFAVASKSYQVNGTIAYEAQLIAAVVNTRSGIKGRLRYTYNGTGNDMTCSVSGTIDGEEYTYTSPPIGGITPKNSPLWKTDPQQQLGYFSARSWARRYTPEVILGVYDREEAEQFRGPDNARDITPAPNVMDRLKAAQNATETSQDEREGFSRDFVHSETESQSTGFNHDFGDDEPTLDLSSQDDAGASPASTEEAGGENVPASTLPASSTEPPWIVTAARMLWAATHPGGGLVDTDECLDVLNNQRKAVGALMPEGTDQRTRDKAGSIYNRCKQVVMLEIDQHDAKAIIAGIAGIEERELGA